LHSSLRPSGSVFSSVSGDDNDDDDADNDDNGDDDDNDDNGDDYDDNGDDDDDNVSPSLYCIVSCGLLALFFHP
jgi:hypothetical protein